MSQPPEILRRAPQPTWIRFHSLKSFDSLVAKGGFNFTEKDQGIAAVMNDMDQREWSWRNPKSSTLPLKGKIKAAVRCFGLWLAEKASHGDY